MDALSGLIDALRGLPGVGPKSAQRLAYQLLQKRSRGLHLAACLHDAMQSVVHCARCNNYTTSQVCSLCNHLERDHTLLCVVEGPADVAAIEQSGMYRGDYYVLMGKISPLEGVGPEQLALQGLQQRIEQQAVTEVILALSPTLEGETTVHFIHECLQPYAVRITQLAHGIPSGGALAFLDANTIGNALRHRRITFEHNTTI